LHLKTEVTWILGDFWVVILVGLLINPTPNPNDYHEGKAIYVSQPVSSKGQVSLTLQRLCPKHDAVETGLVDVDRFVLMVIIWVGGWVVQRPIQDRHPEVTQILGDLRFRGGTPAALFCGGCYVWHNNSASRC